MSAHTAIPSLDRVYSGAVSDAVFGSLKRSIVHASTFGENSLAIHTSSPKYAVITS